MSGRHLKTLSPTLSLSRSSELRSCANVNVEVPAVLGFPSLISLMVCARGRKATLNERIYRLTELRSCVKVEVAVLGFPVDVKEH